MAGGALMPEYFNRKLNTAILLAPAAAMKNNPSKVFQFLAMKPCR